MNPFTKEANFFRLLPRVASKMSRGRLSPSKGLPLLGRKFINTPRGSTAGEFLKKHPVKATYNTVMGPKFKYRKPLLMSGMVAGVGESAHQGAKVLQDMDQTARGFIQETIGAPLDDAAYKKARWEVMKRLASAGKNRVVDKLKAIFGLARNTETFTEPELAGKVYENIIHDNLLPAVRHKIQARKKGYNPYTKPTLKRYFTHPSALVATNLGKETSLNVFDKLLGGLGIPVSQSNPFALSRYNTPALRSKAMNAYTRDVATLAADIGPEKYKKPLSVIRDNMDTIGPLIGAQTLSTLNLKNPNILDAAYNASLGGVLAGSYAKPSESRAMINTLLEADVRPHVSFNSNTIGLGHHYTPYYDAVVMDSLKSSANPGILAHELGHSMRGSGPVSDVFEDLAAGSRMYSSLNLPMGVRSRYTDPLTDKLIPTGSDAAVGLAAADAAMRTPMVADETIDSITGARFAYNRMKGKDYITPYQKGTTLAGTFSGLPSYYGNAYAPLYEQLEARSNKKELELKNAPKP